MIAVSQPRLFAASLVSFLPHEVISGYVKGNYSNLGRFSFVRNCHGGGLNLIKRRKKRGRGVMVGKIRARTSLESDVLLILILFCLERFGGGIVFF